VYLNISNNSTEHKYYTNSSPKSIEGTGMGSEYPKRNRNIITIKTEDENYGIAIKKRDIKGDNDDYYVSKEKKS
jgi:hypothetical protein